MLLTLALVAASVAFTETAEACQTKACVQRVARKQCSQKKPIPCIRRAALLYRQSFPMLLRISRCESRLQANARNGSSGSGGLMQILGSTWATTPYWNRNRFRAKWNALGGAWLMKVEGTSPWNASRGCWA